MDAILVIDGYLYRCVSSGLCFYIINETRNQANIAQTQDRMWKALKRRYQYDSNLNPAQMFLPNHINSKIPLAIMYLDLVGSINMSMTLPIDKLVSIIRAFTYEVSCIIQSHKGY